MTFFIIGIVMALPTPMWHAAVLLSTHLSHDIIWRVLISFGALPALAVYGARRHFKESSRFLKASGHEEDGSGKPQVAGLRLATLRPLGHALR